MMTDMEIIRLWIMPICALISAGAAVWLWLTSPAKAAAAAAAAVGGRVNDLERRVDKVELELKHLPDVEDIQAMALALESLRGDIKVLSTKMETALAISARLQDFLEQGK